ncbi:MAG: hypothetical protein FWH55_02250 [Oscillospiraceae bacterium]|nr:hypothetical protein [Oscillospiraceae bacterium]
MNNNELIDKIYSMVQQELKKLDEGGAGRAGESNACCAGDSLSGRQPECKTANSDCTDGCDGSVRKKPLILTEEHGTTCHNIYERLGGICALLDGYDVDMGDVCCVILYDLTLDNMFKLASGCIDSPYTKLAARAMLEGKPIYAVSEGVELLSFEQCGSAYFRLLNENLSKLKMCGVSVVAEDDLERVICGKNGKNGKNESGGAPSGKRHGSSVGFEAKRKVLTEGDVRQAYASGLCEIFVGAKTIITSLAAELAAKKDISITRR